MEKLCRAMQKERTLLYNEIKINPAVTDQSLSLSDFPSELSDALVELKLTENNEQALSNNTVKNLESSNDDSANVSILEM